MLLSEFDIRGSTVIAQYIGGNDIEFKGKRLTNKS